MASQLTTTQAKGFPCLLFELLKSWWSFGDFFIGMSIHFLRYCSVAIQEKMLHKLGSVIHPEVCIGLQGVSEIQDFADDVRHSVHDLPPDLRQAQHTIHVILKEKKTTPSQANLVANYVQYNISGGNFSKGEQIAI